MNRETFLENYPNARISSEAVCKRHGEVASSTLKTLWQNENYVKKKSDALKERHQDPNDLLVRKVKFNSGKKRFRYYSEKQDKLFSFRSTWEGAVANYLDNKGIIYEYESFTVQYGDNFNYYPDFYLPEYHLILEVHPENLIDEVMIQKRNACIEHGYSFQFITSQEDLNLIPQCK